jgi:S-adenosyl methyltransferase
VGIVARLMAAVPAGSYLAISHPALDTHQAQAAAQWAQVTRSGFR